jgi:hypothetical protein
MRSIWKGSIAFGLVNVPVKVYSATEDHDVKFHQVHAKDNGRIRYKRVCEVCGEVVGVPRHRQRPTNPTDGQTVNHHRRRHLYACPRNAAARSRCWSSYRPAISIR